MIPQASEASPAERIIKEQLRKKLKALTSMNKPSTLLSLNLPTEEEDTEEYKHHRKFTGDSLIIPSPKQIDDELSIELSDEKN